MEMTLADHATPLNPVRMGRPPLNMKSTHVRFPEEIMDRIDTLVGDKQRAKFIREVVEHALELAELGRKSTEKTDE
jgi:Arc/MetJ-type ribon-helix-helix transcriptional regulator